MSAYNHYEEAKKIALELENGRFSSFAAQIREAMKVGSTGTEIFMMLRACIKPLLSEAELPSHIGEQVHVLYKKLDEALH